MILNKLIKTLSLSLLLISLAIVAQAQQSSDLGKAYYLQAVQKFEQADYSATENLLLSAEEKLGTSNARIAALHVKNYMKLGDKEKASQYLNEFYNFDSSETLQAEMASFVVEIDQYRTAYSAISPPDVGAAYAARINDASEAYIKNRFRTRISGRYDETRDSNMGRMHKIEVFGCRLHFSRYSRRPASVDAKIYCSEFEDRHNFGYGWIPAKTIEIKNSDFEISKITFMRTENGEYKVSGKSPRERCVFRGMREKNKNKVCRQAYDKGDFSQTISFTSEEKVARDKDPVAFDMAVKNAMK